MTDRQGSLFDVPAPPRKRKRQGRGSADTSRQALDRAEASGHLQQVEREVVGALRAHGRLTRHQIADAIGRPLSSVCGRVKSLIDAGEIREAVTAQGDPIIEGGRHVLEVTYMPRRAA